ncbi:MAG: hypothetical protein H6577_21425 [Lewinellaceae bacterium]|nr:hypothetical protein [Saprospiraceae bacterium]MCB9340693.1 hypothetical protein [Lewinellaceae bacterium]
MKTLGKLLFLAFLSIWWSCENGTPTTQQGNGAQDTTSSPPANAVAPPQPAKPDCQMAGTVLEGNQFWAKNENKIVAIAATEETKDPDLGDSHRILEVYDGNNCQQVFKEVLPVNFSADYPYYLSEITYNNISKVIAIRGFEKIYIFDIAANKLVGPLVPKFLNQRFVEDAQSGLIQRMEIWENYLIGYAASMGTFVFDLSNPEKPVPVLPAAEYEVEKGTIYYPLFLLKSLDEDDGFQVLLPQYDADKGDFKINALFEKPKKIETNIPKTFRNNRYLVLRELSGGNESRPIAIDMSQRKMYTLPDDVAKMKDTDIIAWMKKN